MKVSDFDYDLPAELIAQHPLENRSSSRLLVLDRKTGLISHHYFSDLLTMLGPNDVLVLNDTKVIPSRIYGNKIDTDALIELLLLEEVAPNEWEALVRPARRVKVGSKISFNNKMLIATCIKVKEEGLRIFTFSYQGVFLEILEKIGTMPLPPYIHEELIDQNRYQTVYANTYGSAAAPTAGLHFTNELLTKLKEQGVEIYYLTLHVGLGTFRPVMTDTVEKHHMHSEKYTLNHDVASSLNKAKAQKKRIISVGTTTTRTLEAIFQRENSFIDGSGETNIFIYPPYEFKAIDALITNFHLPKSTLLMLVSAFASKELIIKAYEEAIKYQYRFFSFGDAMFIK